jgi:hypothetical protein
MENNYYLKDEQLEELFKNRIIQYDNYNSNSELFINGDTIFKIYNGDSELDTFNKSVIKNIFNKYKYLSNINELVIPSSILIYNNHIVGFSMPYIEGNSLEEIINKDKDYDMKNIFNSLLSVIIKCEELPFDFSIGDMHEKNIIVDKDNNVKIIDPDSYIIDNNKLCIDGEYLVGKYPNHYYNNCELERIKNSTDYYSLLCIILNYSFKDIIEDIGDPVNWIKQEEQFKELHPIMDRVDENFVLREEDIDKILDLKERIDYTPKDNKEVINEIKRITKSTKEYRKV